MRPYYKSHTSQYLTSRAAGRWAARQVYGEDGAQAARMAAYWANVAGLYLDGTMSEPAKRAQAVRWIMGDWR